MYDDPRLAASDRLRRQRRRNCRFAAIAIRIGRVEQIGAAMDCVEAMHSRGSTRSFQSKPIPSDVIENIIRDAATAPPPFSADHAPIAWTFYVFEGVERIADFNERAKRFAKDHGTAVPGLIDRPDYRLFWLAPLVVLIAGAAEDCGRAGMLLALSAHARGVGSCWVGSPMPWLRDPKTRADLGLSEVPGAAFCLGYAAEAVEAGARERTGIAAMLPPRQDPVIVRC